MPQVFNNIIKLKKKKKKQPNIGTQFVYPIKITSYNWNNVMDSLLI